MKRKSFFLLFLLFSAALFAQNLSPGTPYLLPQTIFVGDSGRLVVPLGRDFSGVAPFVQESFDMPDETPDLTIKRIELEHRGGQSRLLVDFVPYVPGVLSLPPLEILVPDFPFPKTETSESQTKLQISAALEIQVASILDPSVMTLSGPALPLAAPGTGVLVYGTAGLILLVLFLGIGGSLWGRRHFAEIWERLRRRHLLRNMTVFLRRLRQECGGEKSKSLEFYLSLLSGEYREFLSLFTGINCRSYTAEEFLKPPPEQTAFTISARFFAGHEGSDTSPLNATFLCRLFRTWDTLRFSGRDVDKADIVDALDGAGKFTAALDKAERERPLKKIRAASADKTAALVSPAAGETA